ncbi:uncharacterized protein ARMOST_20230 [Armillaria ostoyae]|uniref:Uncharacterized protein n=1 Tax=Armillaria ostoyae TaxID=47428 RepID=A0A284S6S6_ARMOS|nr:uncharacterized protein ARMOST_20230 [Armillaria ostoyae]
MSFVLHAAYDLPWDGIPLSGYWHLEHWSPPQTGSDHGWRREVIAGAVSSLSLHHLHSDIMHGRRKSDIALLFLSSNEFLKKSTSCRSRTQRDDVSDKTTSFQHNDSVTLGDFVQTPCRQAFYNAKNATFDAANTLPRGDMYLPPSQRRESEAGSGLSKGGKMLESIVSTDDFG